MNSDLTTNVRDGEVIVTGSATFANTEGVFTFAIEASNGAPWVYYPQSHVNETGCVAMTGASLGAMFEALVADHGMPTTKN